MARIDLMDEYAAASLAMDAACERHDFIPLAERLRNAAVLFPHERDLAADIITGKLRPPKHRPPDPKIEARNFLLAYDVMLRMENDGMCEKDAVGGIAKERGVSTHLVRKAVAAHPQLRARSRSWKEVGALPSIETC